MTRAAPIIGRILRGPRVAAWVIVLSGSGLGGCGDEERGALVDADEVAEVHVAWTWTWTRTGSRPTPTTRPGPMTPPF